MANKEKHPAELSFWNLDSVRAWFDSKPLDLSYLEMGFISLNVLLTDSEDQKIRNEAIRLTGELLAALDKILQNKTECDSLPMAAIFAVLMTILAEAGPYRYETYKASYNGDKDRERELRDTVLPAMKDLRKHAAKVLESYFGCPVFASLKLDIDKEILPLASCAIDRYMPFRVLQVGKIAERLYDLQERISDKPLESVLTELHDVKYPRFGTSGIRGRWGIDFTELKAKRVVQAICDYLKARQVPNYIKAENLQKRIVVIGYDSRQNADQVALWAAQVCLLNDLQVHLAARDTPTPAVNYYALEYLGEAAIAGIINCTASHNPVEWQGIKFYPRSGCPASTSLTDFIATRANQYQLINAQFPPDDLRVVQNQGRFKEFDPIEGYCNWLLPSNQNNHRIQLDIDAIKRYFHNKLIILDEMHGAGRGYLRAIMDELGIDYEVLHGEKDPKLGNLGYANPEEPFIGELKEKVRASNAILGLAMDTDADRYGVVDQGGLYIRPNQILPMLTRYLVHERGYRGRIVTTQTGSPLIDLIARMNNDDESKPDPSSLPAYLDHPFYERVIGEREVMAPRNVFVTPVGIKYIIEISQFDRSYRPVQAQNPTWRQLMLLGGEESSGLTTKGHIPDKDGVWANLLIMDMIAFYRKSLKEIWVDLGAEYWVSFGSRADVDACDEAKEGLLNYFFDSFNGAKPGEIEIEGLRIIYLGGVRYDSVEIRLAGQDGDDRHFLRIRASGTEPLIRIYTESVSPQKREQLEKWVLEILEGESMKTIKQTHESWRLVDILAATKPTKALLAVVIHRMRELSGDTEFQQFKEGIIEMLREKRGTVELRNKQVVDEYILQFM